MEATDTAPTAASSDGDRHKSSGGRKRRKKKPEPRVASRGRKRRYAARRRSAGTEEIVSPTVPDFVLDLLPVSLAQRACARSLAVVSEDSRLYSRGGTPRRWEFSYTLLLEAAPEAPLEGRDLVRSGGTGGGDLSSEHTVREEPDCCPEVLHEGGELPDELDVLRGYVEEEERKRRPLCYHVGVAKALLRNK